MVLSQKKATHFFKHVQSRRIFSFLLSISGERAAENHYQTFCLLKDSFAQNFLLKISFLSWK